MPSAPARFSHDYGLTEGGLQLFGEHPPTFPLGCRPDGHYQAIGRLG